MPKLNRRPLSPTEDLTAKQTFTGTDTKTANSNIAAKREARNSLLTEVAKSSRRQPTGAPVGQGVNALQKNHPEKSSVPAVGIPGQLTPGKLFACFELQRELENRSTGSVWLAQDYSPKRHFEQVALKFLPDFIVSGKISIEELKAEIRRRIALKHPNILSVYDLVENKGRIAIQMEYLEGHSLSHLRMIKPNQIFEVRDLEKWMKDLCEALEYAHKSAGLIAGDILPENLIVDPGGNLKLKDFGIANCITDSMRRLMAIHDTSETLPYGSPQRIAGEKPAITDDLYSLGANIYELLTGKPPFYAGDIRDQVNGKPPPSMSERRTELGIKGDAIPKYWEETVAACLAKDPVQRPQSASEVGNRLKNATPPSSIPSASTANSEPKPVSKPRVPVRNPLTWKRRLGILGVIFFLALFAATAFFLFHQRSDRFVPVQGPSPTPAVPPSPSGTIGKDGSPWVTTPPPEGSPAPAPEASPAPAPEGSPAPDPEASAAPAPEAVLTPTSDSVTGPSPEAIPTSSSELSRTLSPQEATILNAKQSTEPSPTPLSLDEIDATKEEVVKRINALPGVSAQRKATLIGKMHKARSMERLTVVPFDVGQTILRRAATDELLKAFSRPETRDKLSDPTTILVVAGYADTVGRADKNLRVSQERAENVSKVLREQANLLNAMQTIGMGGTELLDSKRPDQNRVVEVWVVVPL